MRYFFSIALVIGALAAAHSLDAQTLVLIDTIVLDEIAADTLLVDGEVVLAETSRLILSRSLVIIQADSSLISIKGSIQGGEVDTLTILYRGAGEAVSAELDLRTQRKLTIGCLVFRASERRSNFYEGDKVGMLRIRNAKYLEVQSGSATNISVKIRDQAATEFTGAGILSLVESDSVILRNMNFNHVYSSSIATCVGSFDVDHLVIKNCSFVDVRSADTSWISPTRFTISGVGSALVTQNAKSVRIESIVVDSAFDPTGSMYFWADTVRIINSHFSRSGHAALYLTANVGHTDIEGSSFVRGFMDPFLYSNNTTCRNSIMLGNRLAPWGSVTSRPNRFDIPPEPAAGALGASIKYLNCYVAGEAYGDLPSLEGFPYDGVLSGSLDTRFLVDDPLEEWASPGPNSPLIDAGIDCGSPDPTDAFGNPRTVGASCDIGAVERQDVTALQTPTGVDEPSLTAFPNPARSFVKLSLEGLPNNVTAPAAIQLFDAAGQLVYEGLHPVDASTSLYLPLTHLPAGLYQVAVRVDGHLLTTRLTLQ